MNTEKNLIERLKIVLGLAEAPAEVKLAQAKLEDGTVVEYEGDELAVGSVVYVVPAEGDKSLAPEGEHTLEDGSKIMVDAEGKVTEILEKEDEVEPEPAEEEEVKAALTPEEQTAIVSELMQILEPRLAALEEALLLMGKEYKDKETQMRAELQKLSAEPGAEPVKPKVTLPEAENALQNVLNKRKNK